MTTVSPFSPQQHLLTAELDRSVPSADTPPSNVHRAIRYTLLGPSKRVRGVLTLLVADLFGASSDPLPAGAAIELVHASSLILDDLPAMDDTPVRRGLPANHVEFGEATAILAAVGLLNLAFGRLADAYEPPLASALTRVLSETVGSDGLIGGQAADLQLPAQAVDLSQLEPVHHRKTAVLFRAAATAGALVGNASEADVACVAAIGDRIGLAFQIVDDVLDVQGDGAGGNPDHRHGHVAWIADPISGMRRAQELCRSATHALDRFGGRATRLKELAKFVVDRTE